MQRLFADALEPLFTFGFADKQEDVALGAEDHGAGVAASPPDGRTPQLSRPRQADGGSFARPLVELVVLIAILLATWYIVVNVWHLLSQDVVEYRQYAEQFWLTHLRFRSLPTEYPPLAIAPFSLTLLPPSGDPWVTFACWMGVAVVALYFAMSRFASRRRAATCVAYLLLGASAVFLGRYDLIPALATLAALWAAARQRFALAYVLLAVGILLKLYPAFLVPVVVIEQWRGVAARDTASLPQAGTGTAADGIRGVVDRLARAPATRRMLRDVAVAMGIVALGFAISFVLSPSGTLSEFKYAKDRPVQVESVPATLLWLGTFLGFPAHSVFSFKSFNYVGTLDRILESLSTVTLVAGCLWVYARELRGKLSMSRAMLATLCVVLVANKVFSAQYLIWVVPFVAEVEGVSLVWIAICALTTLEYPILYNQQHVQWAVAYNTSYLLVLAARNALLIVAMLQATLGRDSASGTRVLSRSLSALGLRRAPVEAPQRLPDPDPVYKDAAQAYTPEATHTVGGADVF